MLLILLLMCAFFFRDILSREDGVFFGTNPVDTLWEKLASKCPGVACSCDGLCTVPSACQVARCLVTSWRPRLRGSGCCCSSSRCNECSEYSKCNEIIPPPSFLLRLARRTTT